MKAETTRRPLLPACASTLRMKCTRQRCQEACSTLPTAAFMPSCASEITSLTPRRPRRASERRKSVQKVSASEAPIAMPEHLAPAVGVDADGDDHRDRDDAPAARGPSRRSRPARDTASPPPAAGGGNGVRPGTFSSLSTQTGKRIVRVGIGVPAQRSVVRPLWCLDSGRGPHPSKEVASTRASGRWRTERAMSEPATIGAPDDLLRRRVVGRRSRRPIICEPAERAGPRRKRKLSNP